MQWNTSTGSHSSSTTSKSIASNPSQATVCCIVCGVTGPNNSDFIIHTKSNPITYVHTYCQAALVEEEETPVLTLKEGVSTEHVPTSMSSGGTTAPSRGARKMCAICRLEIYGQYATYTLKNPDGEELTTETKATVAKATSSFYHPNCVMGKAFCESCGDVISSNNIAVVKGMKMCEKCIMKCVPQDIDKEVRKNYLRYA